jgi:hypothetical protein
MRRWVAAQAALLCWLAAAALANMTDRNTGGNNLVNKLAQAIYTSSTTFTITPGTGGGSAFTITPPFFLRLMTTQGSNTANGTEAAGNGYTAGGSSMGATAYGAPSGGVMTNSNSVSWTASGGNLGGGALNAIETWDSAATKLRYQQGSITAVTVSNGNTLTFAAGSITADHSQW